MDMRKKGIFIAYLNDDNSKASAYIDSVQIDNSIVRFETDQNWITIPLNRVLKIKEEKVERQNELKR